MPSNVECSTEASAKSLVERTVPLLSKKLQDNSRSTPECSCKELTNKRGTPDFHPLQFNISVPIISTTDAKPMTLNLACFMEQLHSTRCENNVLVSEGPGLVQ